MPRPLSRREKEMLDAAFRRALRDDACREQKGFCSYCEEPITIRTATADHVRARADGGLDRRNNIVAACLACNRLKGKMKPEQFRRLVRDPKRGDPIAFWQAWARWRINRRLRLMDNRLAAFFGRPVR